MADVQTPTSSPSFSALLVNHLFSVSLACSLLTAFCAVVAQQWVLFYGKRPSGGVKKARWEQYQKVLRAEEWHMEEVIEGVLPTLLQVAVFAFIGGFIAFLHLTSPTLAWPTSALAALVVMGYLFTTAAALWDVYCPFQTTLSRLSRQAFGITLTIIWTVLLLLGSFVVMILAVLLIFVGPLGMLCGHRRPYGAQWFDALRDNLPTGNQLVSYAGGGSTYISKLLSRFRETDELLQAKAVGWIMATTEDEAALEIAAVAIACMNYPHTKPIFRPHNVPTLLRQQWQRAADTIAPPGSTGSPSSRSTKAAQRSAVAYSSAVANLSFNLKGDPLDPFTFSRFRDHNSRSLERVLAALRILTESTPQNLIHPIFIPSYLSLFHLALLLRFGSTWGREVYWGVTDTWEEHNLRLLRIKPLLKLVAVKFYPILPLNDRRSRFGALVVAEILAWLPADTIKTSVNSASICKADDVKDVLVRRAEILRKFIFRYVFRNRMPGAKVHANSTPQGRQTSVHHRIPRRD